MTATLFVRYSEIAAKKNIRSDLLMGLTILRNKLFDFCCRSCAICFALFFELVQNFWLQVEREADISFAVVLHLRFIF